MNPRRAERARRSLRCAVLLVLALWQSACGGPSPDSLPPLPVLDMDAMLPVVQEQIGRVLERLESKPGDEQANGRLGMILHAYRYLSAAEPCYRRARAIGPDTFRWTYYHARTLEGLGEYAAALDAMNVAVALDPDYTPARLGLAALLDANARSDEARTLLEQLVEREPGSAAAHYALGRALADAGETDQAVSAFERSLAIREDPSVSYALAAAYRGLGRVEDAQAQLARYERQRGVQLRLQDPLMAEVQALDLGDARLIAQAQGLAAAGRMDDAVAALEKAVQNNPDSAAARATLVAIYARIGQFDNADRQYRAALEIEPGLAELHYNLGLARLYEQRNVEAAEAFERAIDINPARPEAYLQLAVAYTAQHQSARAIDAYRRALDTDPLNAQVRLALGEALVSDAAYSEALDALEPLVVPGSGADARALHLLATARSELGDTAAAIALWERARANIDRRGNARLATEIDLALRDHQQESSP